jgi:hypothetical protein
MESSIVPPIVAGKLHLKLGCSISLTLSFFVRVALTIELVKLQESFNNLYNKKMTRCSVHTNITNREIPHLLS